MYALVILNVHCAEQIFVTKFVKECSYYLLENYLHIHTIHMQRDY